jgi:hypothetical protein
MRNLAAGTMTAAVLATLALAPAAGAAKQADLKLTSAKALDRKPAYLFLNRNDMLHFAIKVTNNGPDATRSGGTLKVIDPTTGTSFHSVRFRTPSIRPGHSFTAHAAVKSRYMIGIDRYRTRACVASTRDRNTRDNCRNGSKFTVIPRRWVGRVEGTYPFDPFSGTAVEKSIAEVSFIFTRAKNVFFYKGSGAVTYSASGTYAGCDYGGGGTLNIDVPKTALQIRPDLSSYYGTGSETNENYTITVTCGILGPRPPEKGPKNPGWWATPSKVVWGADKRKIASTNADILGKSWKWELNPE